MECHHILTVIFVIISATSQQVKSDSFRDSLDEVERKINDLDGGLEDHMEKVYHRNRRDLEVAASLAARIWPDICLLADVAVLELLHYKRERRALEVAKDLVGRYIADTLPNPTSWPQRRRWLADHIVSRSIQRAFEAITAEEQERRIRLYAVGEHYLYQGRGGAHLSQAYFTRSKDRNAIAAKAKADLDKSFGNLQRYMGDIAAQRIADQVDVLVVEADSLLDHTHLPGYIDQLSWEIAHTERLCESHRSFWNITNRQEMIELDMNVQLATLHNVTEHETLLVPPSLVYITHIDDDMAAQRRSFEAVIMQEVFHEPQQTAEARGDMVLRALSARIAEARGMMYASERRVMRVTDRFLRDFFIDKTKRLPDILAPAEDLYEFIIDRFRIHALETGLVYSIRARKEIYLLAMQDPLSETAQELVNSFKGYLHYEYNYYHLLDRSCFRSLERYKYEMTPVSTAAQKSQFVRVVDTLIDEALSDDDLRMLPHEQWLQLGQEDMIPTYMLRTFIGDGLFERISAAKAAYALDADRVKATDFRDVLNFEDGL